MRYAITSLVVVAFLCAGQLSFSAPQVHKGTASDGKSQAAPGATHAKGLTEAMLKNATVFAPDEGDTGGMHRIDFKNGAYHREAGEDITDDKILNTAVADLNGDGINDGAIVYYESGGGSGRFMRMSVFLCENGKPVQIGYRTLGDRSGPKSLKIKNGVIALEIWTHGSDDAANSPNVPRLVHYRVRGTKLVGPDDIW